MKIIEFVCSQNHHTECNVEISQRDRRKVDRCQACGELVELWSNARFRKVQPGAEARTRQVGIFNQLGAGDWVEARRKEVLDAYGVDYYKWNYGRKN